MKKVLISLFLLSAIFYFSTQAWTSNLHDNLIEEYGDAFLEVAIQDSLISFAHEVENQIRERQEQQDHLLAMALQGIEYGENIDGVSPADHSLQQGILKSIEDLNNPFLHMHSHENYAYDEPSDDAFRSSEEQDITESEDIREITDGDFFQCGSVLALLKERLRQEMIEKEKELFPQDMVLHEYQDQFAYGIQSAADNLEISFELASEIAGRIEEREKFLMEMGDFIDPTDEEIYIRTYVEEFDVPPNFARRVFNEMMGL